MDYKKIIPDQDLRFKILGLTNFLPDKSMIKIQYWIKTGRRLNLKLPQRYTEKIQWYKLYYRDPKMIQCADKYDVRGYIKAKGLEHILIPVHGVYESVDEIDFNLLPNKFVMKTSNGSGTNLFCESKEMLDIEASIKKLNTWLKKRTSKAGREWAYYDIQPKIICEEYLDKDENNDLIDYKFYCFDGKLSHIKVVKNRFLESGSNKGFFNPEFELLPYSEDDAKKIETNLVKPKNYELMLNIVKKLSEDFPHVRVDLYNINGKIYFGELTFYDMSGYITYTPDEFDYIIGNKFILPKLNKLNKTNIKVE